MKCPFRKVTSYSRVIKTIDISSGREIISNIESCSESEAHYKNEEFAECLKLSCPFYNGTCKYVNALHREIKLTF